MMAAKRSYDPTEQDVVWAYTMLNLLKEGGVLVYPASGFIYKVNHQARSLSLQQPKTLTTPDEIELHDRTKLVFGVVNYEVFP